MSLVLLGCAQVRELQGGAKDEVAPVLLEAWPPIGSVHFNARQVLLRFDERIKLDRVQERMLISPPLATRPDVVLGRSNEVVIKLRSALAPHTTYVFHIGEAVVDITEGNAAAGLAYVVSTGDRVDSATVSGRLMDAFSGAAVDKALVMAYAWSDTTKVLSGLPSYFTRSDAQGRFRIPYMAPGTYGIAALIDKNANYRYDLPNEEIAFLDSAVHTDAGEDLVLRMFREQSAVQQLQEMRVMPDRSWRLVLGKSSRGLSVHQLDRVDDPLIWYQEWSATRDTALLWPSDTALLTGQRFELREEGLPFDTITYRPMERMPYDLRVERMSVPPAQGVVLRASRPLMAFDSSRVRWVVDSLPRPFVGTLDSLRGRLFRAPWEGGAERRSTLELLPGAFTDMYRGTNDTIRWAWGGGVDQSGKLDLRTALDSGAVLAGPLILQLVNAQGATVREMTLQTLPARATWADLPAGEYTLRMIEDLDANGRWTTGRSAEHRQPERVLHQGIKHNLRAGWELAVEWVVVP